jgi:hypothetical protein
MFKANDIVRINLPDRFSPNTKSLWNGTVCKLLTINPEGEIPSIKFEILEVFHIHLTGMIGTRFTICEDCFENDVQIVRNCCYS